MHLIADPLTLLSFRDIFFGTWDPSWLTPFSGQSFPVLLLGKRLNLQLLQKIFYYLKKSKNMKAIRPCDFTTLVQLCTFKVIVVYDDGQNHLLVLFFHQVADVWLCDANEAGGPAEWRLFLH